MGFQSGNFPYKLPKLSNTSILTPNWKGINLEKRRFAPTFLSTAQRFSSSNDNWGCHPSYIPIAKGDPSGPAYWLRTVIGRNTPENRRIVSLKDKGIRSVVFRDWLWGNLIVTRCFQRRIEEEINRANPEKEHQEILRRATISPANVCSKLIFRNENYQ